MDKNSPNHPDNWAKQPMVAPNNANGLPGGVDGDWRSVRPLEDNLHSPLVQWVGDTAAIYEGVDPYTGKLDENSKAKVGGGLPGGIVVVRESLARALDEADKAAKMLGFRFRLHDGFRTQETQMLQFTNVVNDYLAKAGVDLKKVSTKELLEAATLSDTMCTYLALDTNNADFARIEQILLSNATLIGELENYAFQKDGTMPTLPRLKQFLKDYIAFVRNTGIRGEVHPDALQAPVSINNNPHLTGAACDIRLIDATTGKPRPMAVPVDYLGPEGAFAYLENTANHDKYIAAARARPDLREHLKRSGLPRPERLTFADLHVMQATARVHFRIMQLVGAEWYNEESQHHEGGNVVYSALTGNIVYAEPETSVRYFGSGTPGVTDQRFGVLASRYASPKEGIPAVYGGRDAHRKAEKWGYDQ